MGSISNSPHRGQLLRDYELTKTDGSTLMLSDFRNKLNVVLIIFNGALTPAQTQWLRQLAGKSDEVRENETRVIVAVPAGQQIEGLPAELIVASDESGRVLRDLAAGPSTAVYFTDKFREVFHVYRIAQGEPLPSVDEILGWIKFVAMQCPECHPPEWPADAL